MAESLRQAKEQMKGRQIQLTTAGTLLPFSLLTLSLAKAGLMQINDAPSVLLLLLSLVAQILQPPLLDPKYSLRNFLPKYCPSR